MLRPPPTVKDDADDALEHFLVLAQREPCYQAVQDFWHMEQQHKAGGPQRLSTPSAEEAGRGVVALRTRFTSAIVIALERTELLEAWSLLTLDEQDSFLCRLFLPRALGGLLLRNSGAGAVPGEEHGRSVVHEEEETLSDIDSEINACLPEEDDRSFDDL